jgi:hypothetical protein
MTMFAVAVLGLDSCEKLYYVYGHNFANLHNAVE